MVTRSSLVWVMTGIAAGIAGGWLWNRERGIDVEPPTPTERRNAPIRSPFTSQHEERGPSYLSASRANREKTTERSSEFSHRLSLYDEAGHADRGRLDSMLADARGLANPRERRSSLEILLLRYAELDLEGALGQAVNNDRETNTYLLGALTAVAPEATWERALQATNAAERFAYLSAVVATWAADDPEHAFSKVAALPAEWQRSELMQAVISEIANRDPRLAIRLAQSEGQVESAPLVDLIATQWSRQNPSDAARWVEGLPRADQGRLAYRIANAYVAQKPGEALAWALRLSGSPRRYLWSAMLGEMAQYDPDQALALAQTAESPAQRAQAMGKVLAAIAQTNPDRAMSQLSKMPPGEARWEVLDAVASSVATLTPGTALDWLNGIDDKAMQREATRFLGAALAQRNVEAAADMVDRVPKEGRPNWITTVALAYANVDIERGQQWVRRYGSEGTDTAFQFARTVASRNPEMAVQLVSGVTDDGERDRLLRGMLQPLAEHSPALAARWAEKVTDEDTRTRMIGEVANTWARYDSAGARKWILSLSDSPAKDQALTALVARSGESLDDMLPIINEIRTPERRSHVVLMAAMRLAQNDEESARTLLRRYPLDAARQRQFDDYMQQQQRRNKGQ